MKALGTILGVWAHPDDETYLSGGLMASAVRADSRVVCITATRGEAGSRDEERWPSAEIAGVREAELAAALRILGVGEHHWLGYPDGGCASVAHEEAEGRIARIMAAVQPDSVLTFGPDGMTGHPDHIAVSDWTTQAFRRAAPPGARLLYATTTPEWVERFVARLSAANVFAEGTPPITAPEDLAVDFRLDPALLHLKVAAIKKQVSQVEDLIALFGEDFLRASQTQEAFRLAEVR